MVWWVGGWLGRGLLKGLEDRWFWVYCPEGLAGVLSWSVPLFWGGRGENAGYGWVSGVVIFCRVEVWLRVERFTLCTLG